MLSTVQGQTEGVRFLRRVVEGHVTTPLLLVGAKGTGRRFSVIEAAKEAFSQGDPESIHCVQIAKGIHPDLVVVQPEDGKAIGVDAARAVVEQARSFPSMVPFRYVVIDGVDNMTIAAANVLLKTLEEQPPTTRFFLLAETASAVLPTIRSRCGVVRYRPLPEKLIVEFLREHTDDDAKALVCCRLAEGSVGRAYQYLASGRLSLRNKVLSLLRIGLTRDVSSLFSAIDEIESDLDRGLHFLDHLLRDLLMLPHAPSHLTNVDIVDQLSGLRAQIGEARLDALLRGIRQVRDRSVAKIILPFHVKACFLAAFSI